MEVAEAIRSRRSIRRFTEQPVPREILNALVSSAVLAPTASNLQAWRFIIVDDPAIVRKINMFSPGMSGGPTAIIVICSDYGYAESKKAGKHYKEYGCIMDASMAAENLMLSAVDHGLGTCAIKSYTEKAVRKILFLPETLHLELLITVGYPDGEPRSITRKPFEDIVRYNSWESEA